MCRSESCSLPVAAVLSADMPFPHPRTQPMKPRLPRKLANSARINLNKYWHALEELMPVSCRAFDESDSNAINENLDNERRLAAMRLSEPLGVGNTDASNSSGRSIPSLCNSLGKKTSCLKISSTPANTQIVPAESSSMKTDDSWSGSCKPFINSTSTSIAESSSFFPLPNTKGYPDENIPPANGPSTTSR